MQPESANNNESSNYLDIDPANTLTNDAVEPVDYARSGKESGAPAHFYPGGSKHDGVVHVPPAQMDSWMRADQQAGIVDGPEDIVRVRGS